METKKEKTKPTIPKPKKSSGSEKENLAVRFNLVLLESEKERVCELQSICKRRFAVLNQSEILRAGIGALERLSKHSPELFQEVIDMTKRL